MLKTALFCLITGSISVQAQNVSITSRVVRSGGGIVAGATVSLLGKPSITTVSDTGGNFTLSGTTAIQPGQASSRYSFNLLPDGIELSLTRRVASGRMEFFTWDGKLKSSLLLDGLETGRHTLAMSRLDPGVYFMRLRMDEMTVSHRLLHVIGGFLDAGSAADNGDGASPSVTPRLAKSAVATDTLLVVKAGYEDAKLPLYSLTQGKVQIILNPLCTIPTLPAVSALPANAKMPDPFKSMSGSRISTRTDWGCRRMEISRQFQNYELGTLPPRPASLTTSFSDTTLTINVVEAGKTMSFKVTVKKPTTGMGPFPVLIGYGGSNLSSVASLGVATLNFNNDEMAKNTGGSTTADRGKGKFYDLYGSTHSASAMMAWAWAVSRIIDALEITPEAGLDPTRIAVTGCSRNGKGAIVAGAFDERIALVIPQESGSGGSGNWRVSDYMLNTLKQSTQDLKEIVGEEPWFSTALNAFSGKVGQLPFDHHMLMGMVAPRGLLVIENDILWLGPMSSFSSAVAGKRIFDALGVPEAITYSEVGKHNHCSFPATQKHWVDSYVSKYLLGGVGEAAKIENDQSLTFDETRWVDWTTPTLQ